MIKILWKSDYTEMTDYIQELEDNLEEEEKKNDIQKAIINRKEKEIKGREQDYVALEKLKDHQINELETKLQMVECDKNIFFNDLQNAIEEKKELTKQVEKLRAALGGSKSHYNREKRINEILVEEKNVIDQELKEANQKIERQAIKIQELSKNQKHSIKEYANDGLRKNLRKKGK